MELLDRIHDTFGRLVFPRCNHGWILSGPQLESWGPSGFWLSCVWICSLPAQEAGLGAEVEIPLLEGLSLVPRQLRCTAWYEQREAIEGVPDSL